MALTLAACTKTRTDWVSACLHKGVLHKERPTSKFKVHFDGELSQSATFYTGTLEWQPTFYGTDHFSVDVTSSFVANPDIAIFHISSDNKATVWESYCAIDTKKQAFTIPLALHPEGMHK